MSLWYKAQSGQRSHPALLATIPLWNNSKQLPLMEENSTSQIRHSNLVAVCSAGDFLGLFPIPGRWYCYTQGMPERLGNSGSSKGFQAGVNGAALTLPWHLHSSAHEVSKADWIIQGSPCNSILGHIIDRKLGSLGIVKSWIWADSDWIM